MVYDDADEPRLYGAGDLPWIARLLDVVERARGRPWREMVERVERAPLGVHASDRTAVLRALRRVAGARRGAAQLSSIVELAWFDHAVERAVELPRRPSELELAAHANIERIQRLVRRAYEVQLRIWDRAREVVRVATQRGLVVDVRSDGDSTQLALLGPLSLLHATVTYGRALATLVPLLADHPRFELDLRCQLHGEATAVQILPPLLLPPRPPEPRAPPSPAEQLARDLADRGHAVEYEPPPIEVGPHRLYPDLAVRHRGTRWLVEVLAYSTPAAIHARLAAYRRAELQVVLCIEAHTALACELDPHVCDYHQRIDADELIASFEAAS
jgi:predicted nuclease of restriction endonuclease-like RecB superfamily